jgi:hypothetical protein
MVPCAVNRPHSDIERTQQSDLAFLPQVVARLKGHLADEQRSSGVVLVNGRDVMSA